MIVEMLLFVAVFLLYIGFSSGKPKDLPPGTWGFPIVGYLPFMEKRLTKSLDYLYRKYGNIFHVKLGSKLCIIVTDFFSIKELFSNIRLSGRPYFYTYDLFYAPGELGIITSSGDVWNTNRRFCLRTLRDFGMGKSKMETIILAEAEALIRNFETMVNLPIQIDWALNVAILNVTWRLVADKRFEINDPKVKQFSKYMNTNLEDIDGPMVIFNYLLWLKPFVPNFIKNSWMRISSLEERRDAVKELMINVIKEHKKTLNRSDPRDYIDQYLIEMENQKENPQFAHFGDNDLIITALNLFTAGSETTSSTIRWLFAYMAKYRDVQKMVQEQIDSVVPRSRVPNLDDKKRLPYLEALTYELSRKISLLPTSLPHEALEDISFNGYTIPKGAVVIPYIEKCHNDPNYWERPDDLYLGHFLDKDGNFVPPKESFVPFSFGRRLCPGESLAKMELFFFFGAILQNFEICEPQDQKVSLEPDQNVSLFNYCVDFKVVLKKRM